MPGTSKLVRGQPPAVTLERNTVQDVVGRGGVNCSDMTAAGDYPRTSFDFVNGVADTDLHLMSAR